ncbi:MAG TPA: transposase [Candidatus Paceibacterota bacterium]
MGRALRTDTADHVYHVLNRANARSLIFEKDADYKLFEEILEEAVEKFNMRLLSYCLMPNHWHLALYPRKDGDLSKFMNWLTLTHTQRWHVIMRTTGQGHLYQGRYKSFICQEDGHFLTLVRYVERNAKKANLVNKAENWQWSSVWRQEKGTAKQKKILSAWPVSKPRDYLDWLDKPQSQEEEEALERSIAKSAPYGGDSWVANKTKRFGLQLTQRTPGRPKGSRNGS